MKNDSLPNFNRDRDRIQIRSTGRRDYYTLCSSCRNAAGCVLQKDRQTPSLFCEEFEIDACLSTEIAEIEKAFPTALTGAENGGAGEFIGLCSNCDSRTTCDFPKPEGGIWHCEEYR